MIELRKTEVFTSELHFVPCFDKNFNEETGTGLEKSMLIWSQAVKRNKQ